MSDEYDDEWLKEFEQRDAARAAWSSFGTEEAEPTPAPRTTPAAPLQLSEVDEPLARAKATQDKLRAKGRSEEEIQKHFDAWNITDPVIDRSKLIIEKDGRTKTIPEKSRASAEALGWKIVGAKERLAVRNPDGGIQYIPNEDRPIEQAKGQGYVPLSKAGEHKKALRAELEAKGIGQADIAFNDFGRGLSMGAVEVEGLDNTSPLPAPGSSANGRPNFGKFAHYQHISQPTIEDKFREKYGDNWADEYNKEQEARTHRRELVATLREDNPWTSYLAGIAGMAFGPEAQAVGALKIAQTVEKATLAKLAEHGVRDVATAAAVADTAAGVMANLPIKQAIAAEIASKTVAIAAENAAFQALGIPGRLVERAASQEPLGLDALWDEVKGLGIAVAAGAAFGPVAGAASANRALRAVAATEAKIAKAMGTEAKAIAESAAVKDAAKIIDQGREARNVLAREEEAAIDRAIESSRKREWLPLPKEEVTKIVDMVAEQAAAFDELMPLQPQKMPEAKLDRGPGGAYNPKGDALGDMVSLRRERFDADEHMMQNAAGSSEADLRNTFSAMPDEQAALLRAMPETPARPVLDPSPDVTAPVRVPGATLPDGPDAAATHPAGSLATLPGAHAQALPVRAYPEGPYPGAPDGTPTEGALQSIVDHEQAKAPSGDIRGEVEAARAKLGADLPPEVSAAKDWLDSYVASNLRKYSRKHVRQIAETTGAERLYTQVVTKALRDGNVSAGTIRQFFGTRAEVAHGMIKRMKADGIIPARPEVVAEGAWKGKKIFKASIDSAYINESIAKKRSRASSTGIEAAVDAWLDTAPSRSGKTSTQLEELKLPGSYVGAQGEQVAKLSNPAGAWWGDHDNVMAPESHLGAMGKIYEKLDQSAEKHPRAFKQYRTLKGEEIARRQAAGVVATGEAAIRKNLDKALIEAGALKARNRPQLLEAAKIAQRHLEQRGLLSEADAIGAQIRVIDDLEAKIYEARHGSFAREGQAVYLPADREGITRVGPAPDFREEIATTQPRSGVESGPAHRLQNLIERERMDAGLDTKIRQNEAGQELAQQRLGSRRHEAAQALADGPPTEVRESPYFKLEPSPNPYRKPKGKLDALAIAGERVWEAVKPISDTLKKEVAGDLTYGAGAALGDKTISKPLKLSVFGQVVVRRTLGRGIYTIWRALADSTFVQRKAKKWKGDIKGAISSTSEAVTERPWHSAFGGATARLLMDEDHKEQKDKASADGGLGEQIRYVIDEIHRMASDPEGTGRRLFEHYQPIRVRNGEDAEKLERSHEQKLMFLDQKLPRNPRPPNPLAPHTDLWRPNEQEAASAANYLLAVNDPVGAITHAMRTGHVASETIETLKELHPELLEQARDWTMEALGNSVGELSIEKRRIISRIFDMPALEPYTSPEFNQDVTQFFAAQAQTEQERNDERQGGASNRKKLGIKTATTGTPAGRQRG